MSLSVPSTLSRKIASPCAAARRYRVRLCVAAILCLSVAVSRAHAAFFEMGLSARAMAMGGAFTSVADDSSAMFWNPAGLAQLAHVEATSMYLSHGDFDLGSARTTLVGGASPIRGVDGLTVAGGLLSTGDPELYEERTTVAAGGYDLYELTTFPAAIGLSIKKLNLSYKGYDPADPLFANGDSAGASEVAIGAIVQLSPSIRVAAVLDNLLGPALNLSVADDQPAVGGRLRFGGAFTHRNYDREAGEGLGLAEMTIAAEYATEAIGPELDFRDVRVGTEFWMESTRVGSGAPSTNPDPGPMSFAGRLGMSMGDNGSALSAGLGIRFALGGRLGLQVDYAFTSQQNVEYGSPHRVSMSVAY